jgi:heme exporter protein A
MKRRLSLARLQLESTKLWILDEPLFGLDDAACTQFKTMLSRHTTSGGAAIIVTHDARLFDGLPYQSVAVGGL